MSRNSPVSAAYSWPTRSIGRLPTCGTPGTTPASKRSKDITPEDIEALENGIARLECALEDHAKPVAYDDTETPEESVRASVREQLQGVESVLDETTDDDALTAAEIVRDELSLFERRVLDDSQDAAVTGRDSDA